MIIDNIRTLINLIVIVSLLLAVCVCVDYASEITVSNLNESKNVNLTETKVVNDTHYVELGDGTGIAKIQNNGKVIISKPKYPIITMTGKPSCSCGRRYSYRWYTRTYINYCPYCHRYGTLYDAHKYQARYEKEITCRRCGSDWCINCGKEKYSWSKRYLRRA